MNSNLPSVFGSISSLFRSPLALLGGALLCLATQAASAQSVSFVGGQTTVSSSSVGSIVVDGSGNLFGFQGNNVVKLSKTATGFGPPIILPFSGLNGPYLMAVDGEGDVFTIDNYFDFLELPWTGSGYGPQVSLPNGFVAPGGLAADSAGDVFVTDNLPVPPALYPDWTGGVLYEYPKSATGYGSPITLSVPWVPNESGYTSFGGIAADGAGDVFVDEYYEGDPNCESSCQRGFGYAVELPKAETGFGPSIGLPVGGFDAVDSAGNLYFGFYSGVAEIPNTGAGYGPQSILPVSSFCGQLAVDSAGNIFFPTCSGTVAEFQRQSVNFGSVNVCTSGAPAPCSETVSLHYNVTASGTLGTPKVLTGGEPGLDFALVGGSTCTGAVTANSSCSVHVTFTPQASGVRNGTVEIVDGSGNVLTTTTISGYGGSPEVQVSPTYLPFGTVPFGSSESLPVTVTNGGAGTLTVTASISGSSNYTVAGSTCGAGVTAGNSCTLQVQFTPSTINAHDGLLTVTTDAGSATVNLAGTGSGLSIFGGVSGAPLQFGTVFNGSTQVLPLTITNVGLPGTITVGTAITVGNTTTPTTTYAVLTTAQNTCQAGITAGQSCTLPVEFAPTSSGNHYDLLTLTPSAGGGAVASTVWLLGASAAAPGQSVVFVGPQSTLPFSGLSRPRGVAVDRAGDVFVSDEGNDRVVKLPQTPTGYGPQISLPFTVPFDVAVDSAEDVIVVADFHSGYGNVQESPWTGTGYGPPITLDFNGLNGAQGVAVDNAGDVFVANSQGGNVQESPWTGAGYGLPIILPLSGLYSPWGVAVDHAGDLFVADSGVGALLEFPKTPTGYGTSATLASYSSFTAIDVALDNAGDAFVSDANDLRVEELLKTATGYGPPTTLPTVGAVSPRGKVGVDGAGDIFVVDGNTVVKVQTQTSAYVCGAGQTIPAPCSVTLTLNFNVYADLTLGTPVVLTGGAPNLDFTLASGSTCTGAVTENNACTVQVTFAPTTTGVRNGTVEIVDGSGNMLTTATISATGVALPTGSPVASVSRDYLPFGPIAFGTSKTLPVTITNTGGGTLTVTPSIAGYSSPPPSAFSYTIAGNTCGGGVTPGSSCAVLVNYSPTSISATHDDLLTLQTNGGDLTVNLAGSSSGLSVLGGVSGAALQFGSVAAGSTEVETLTVTNVGLPGTVKVKTAITVGTTTTHGHSYTILTTAQNTCLAGIAAGQSCTLPVEFAPAMSGNHDDLLTLTPSAGGGSTTVWLLGSTP